ncbi:MAG TPA: peptidylprolyl isomerase [Candidatus Kapabacteria bacterium]|nr:peptidylprolyl isomerase [Candidatus Kapabacteria bacterium]
MNIRQLICLFLIILFFACNSKKQDDSIQENSGSNSPTQEKKDDHLALQNTPRSIPADTSFITHYASLATNMGTFVIALYGQDAPKTVNNFIGLARQGYYNGILFHRVARNFLIQAGDPNTKNIKKKKEWGLGGKSYFGKEFEDELNPNTPSYKLGYIKGTVAMANRGQNTNTSQFFICLDEAINLDNEWTIFGKVIGGIDVVENISAVQVEPSDRGYSDGIPLKPIKINYIKIKKAKISQ